MARRSARAAASSVVHNFPADGEYTFKLTFYYDFLETLFGQNLPANLQGQEIEVSVDGARAALFKIDPNIPETKNILTTPRVRIPAGPHRVSAAFIAKFDGPTEDEFRQVEQIHGRHQRRHSRPDRAAPPAVDDGRRTVRRERRLATRRAAGKIFVCTPASSREETPCAQTDSSRRWRGRRSAARSPMPIWNFLLGLLPGGTQAKAASRAASGWPSRRSSPIPNFVFRFERTPAAARAGRELPHRRSRSGVRACRISCGAAAPTMNCSPSPRRAS